MREETNILELTQMLSSKLVTHRVGHTRLHQKTIDVTLDKVNIADPLPILKRLNPSLQSIRQFFSIVNRY